MVGTCFRILFQYPVAWGYGRENSYTGQRRSLNPSLVRFKWFRGLGKTSAAEGFEGLGRSAERVVGVLLLWVHVLKTIGDIAEKNRGSQYRSCGEFGTSTVDFCGT